MIETDIFEVLAEEICDQCSYRHYIMSSCYDECPFKEHFEELRSKCADIYKDADYLAELAAKEDDVEDDRFYEVDHMTVDEMKAYSQRELR